MDTEVIFPPAPEDVITDREEDRLFQELCWREYKGEFDPSNTELITDEDLPEIADMFWSSWRAT